MIGSWLFGGATMQVRCDIDIEQTPESFHAHAIPDGVELRPGDVVTVHDAPARIAFGDCFTCVRTATVRRAGALERVWTELTALLELTELYEVGFQPKETRP